jgi:anti-sigma regulatory factor (Ser/Thr protein kinase)
MSISELAIDVPAGVDAGHVARHAIAASEPTLPLSVQADVSLLVTELLTNAVRHGGAAADRPLQVEVQRQADRIRVQVIDAGTVFEPPAAAPRSDSSGGWGLFLVDRIAESWGVSGTPGGKCVWFEVPLGATG